MLKKIHLQFIHPCLASRSQWKTIKGLKWEQAHVHETLCKLLVNSLNTRFWAPSTSLFVSATVAFEIMKCQDFLGATSTPDTREDSEPFEVTLEENSSEETCHGWPPWLQISIHQDCTVIYHHEPSTIIYHHLPSTVIKSWTNCCGKYWNGDNWWPPADFSWPSFSALIFQRFCRLHWPLGGLPLEDIKIHGASCENMSEPPIDSWVYQTQVTRAYHQVRQRLRLVKI